MPRDVVCGLVGLQKGLACCMSESAPQSLTPERREKLRRTLAGLVPAESEQQIGPRALSARAAEQQLEPPAEKAPSNPAKFPSSMAEIGRINDTRLASVHRAPTRGRHLVHSPRSNLPLAPPRSWEEVLMAQVDDNNQSQQCRPVDKGNINNDQVNSNINTEQVNNEYS